jgi:endonuclease/exonuclease/phosphatase family metal-dependent hydrolase
VLLLSWNLALLERSAQAPPYWDAGASEAAVRDAVLALGPDLVAFQELPAMVPFVETHMLLRATPRSHSGNLATLVRRALAEVCRVNTVGTHAVLATFPTGLPGFPAGLTVANVHLAPGPGRGPERLVQLVAVVEASPTEALVIIGDTNTRVDEMEAIAAAGLSAPTPPRPTWDSRANRFRSGGHEYVAFFTRWFATSAVTVSDVAVHTEPLAVDGKRFHLSDHYALSLRASSASEPGSPPPSTPWPESATEG